MDIRQIIREQIGKTTGRAWLLKKLKAKGSRIGQTTLYGYLAGTQEIRANYLVEILEVLEMKIVRKDDWYRLERKANGDRESAVDAATA